MRIVHVQWEGPLDRESAFKASQVTDCGVYQIYGSHPVYGLNTLLYIGMADQFGKRLAEHCGWLDREHAQNQVTFFLGRLAGSATPAEDEWGDQIAQVECLLIAAHKPSYNGRSIKEISECVESKIGDLHVVNWGEFGLLLPEVSAARWTKRLSDPPNYKIYGTHPSGV